MVQITAEAQVQSPSQHSGLRIWHFGSYGTGHSSSSDLNPGLGTSTCHGSGQKKKKRERENNDVKGTSICHPKICHFSIRQLRNGKCKKFFALLHLPKGRTRVSLCEGSPFSQTRKRKTFITGVGDGTEMRPQKNAH